MNIGINARRLSGQPFGVARYIEYLLKYWDRLLDDEDSVTLFLRSPFRRPDAKPQRVVRPRVLRPSLTGILWENLCLPRSLANIDVLFCPSYTAPLRCRRPLVVTTHSVDDIHPGTHSSLRHTFYSRLYRRSARAADRVIVPTHATADALATCYGVSRERIEVIGLGVDTELFRPLDDAERVLAVRHRYFGADVPYILFVGKMSLRRNIPLLVEAFADLKRRTRLPHRLLLLGPNHENLPLQGLIAELGVGDSVVQDEGRVRAHADLVPVYAGASVFVHASTYDSTSLPILEAFACGTPVITVRTGGLTEIAQGAAHLIEEPSLEQLSAALELVLTDQALGARLREAGIERASQHSWQHAAARTLDVLRQAAA